MNVLDITSKDNIIIKKAENKPGIITSIIIPALNEEKGLPIVLEKVFHNTNGFHEVIVVDDGSSDGTAHLASKFPCHVIKHEVNRGKGCALKTGVDYAEGENIIFIDSDDTYPAEALTEMTEALETYDLVYGSRVKGRENIPPINRFGNFILQKLIHHIYGFQASDFSTGLYGMKKCHFLLMGLSNTGFCLESEIAIKASRMKLNIKEIPIEYKPRLGESKLGRISAGWGNFKNIYSHIFWKAKKL